MIDDCEKHNLDITDGKQVVSKIYKRRIFYYLPWLLCAVLSVLIVTRELRSYFVSRQIYASTTKRLPESYRSLISDFSYLGQKGPYEVTSWTMRVGTAEKQKFLDIIVANKFRIQMQCGETGPFLESVSIYVDNEDFMDIIGMQGKPFPWQYSIVPQTGPNAKKLRLFDRNCDGTIDFRHNLDNGSVEILKNSGTVVPTENSGQDEK